jgi:hypothetical protein
MALAAERRSSPRFPSVENRVAVHITQDGQSRLARASLINISRTGALLYMSDKVTPHGTIYIRLEYPIKTNWIKGQVIRRKRGGQVGVQFRRPCDRTFFWAATRGEDFHLKARLWSDGDMSIEESRTNHAC